MGQSLTSLEGAHVVPLRWFIVQGRVDGLEPIIVNKMILGRNVASGEISNQSDGFRMNGGHSNKLPASRSRLPLWKLASRGSQAWFQNVNRGAPVVSIAQDLAITDGTGENFNRSNATGGTWSVVIHVHSMLYRQRPKSSVFNFRPVKGCMDHVGSSGGRDEANGALSCSILLFCANSTVTNRLGVRKNFMNESFALEDAIVSVVGLDIHPLM